MAYPDEDFANQAELAQLHLDEFESAVRLISMSRELTKRETKLIASTFAHGFSALHMAYRTMEATRAIEYVALRRRQRDLGLY